MLLTPTASSLALKQPSVPAFNAAASSGVPIAAAVPSLAGRDAVFALLARDFDSPTPVTDRALTPAGASGGQKSVDQLTSLTPGSSEGFGSERSAVDLLDGAWADEENQASAAATDSSSAMLADDAPAEE